MKTFNRLSILILACGLISAQDASRTGGQVRMTVTVEPRHGKDIPALAQEDVLVFHDQNRLPVKNWVASRGESAGLELFILLDDASDTSVASQFQDIRDFVIAQPASTAVGIGYMRNGTIDTVQPLTADHALAVTKLRLPTGNTGSNAFLSLSDLIRRWPASEKRREVLMVTPGTGLIAAPGEEGVHNIFVDAAIADAQRAGVIVYAIYSLGAGHSGHSAWLNLWAQHYLAQVAEETGGEAYSLSFGAPVSLSPYLSDLALHLQNQYLLTFTPAPTQKPGLQPIRIQSEVTNAEIISAAKVYVPGP